jgi:hypothetical protein
MTEKVKIQKIIADWKGIESEADKKVFLEKIRQTVDEKTGAELLSGIKAIGEFVHDLHAQVVQPTAATAPIEVFPADAEEAKLIEDLLSRMRVRFKVA